MNQILFRVPFFIFSRRFSSSIFEYLLFDSALNHCAGAPGKRFQILPPTLLVLTILNLLVLNYLNVMFTELLRGKMERYKMINNNLFVLLLSYLKKSHKDIMILFLNEMYNQLVHCLRLKEFFSSCYYLEFKDYLNVMFTE